MIENNDENREKLADLVADEMDIEALINFVKEVLVERYEEDDESFKYDLQWHVDEDGEWYE